MNNPYFAILNFLVFKVGKYVRNICKLKIIHYICDKSTNLKHIKTMNIPIVFWLVPVASIIALAMAWYFFSNMMKADEGTPRMREIALHVRKGAMAYLKQQYKVDRKSVV